MLLSWWIVLFVATTESNLAVLVVFLVVLAYVNSMKEKKLVVIPKALKNEMGIMNKSDVHTMAKIRRVQFKAA
jgi:hypothetical protein